MDFTMEMNNGLSQINTDRHPEQESSMDFNYDNGNVMENDAGIILSKEELATVALLNSKLDIPDWILQAVATTNPRILQFCSVVKEVISCNETNPTNDPPLPTSTNKRLRTNNEMNDFRTPQARHTAKRPIDIQKLNTTHTFNRFSNLKENILTGPTETPTDRITKIAPKIKPITILKTENYRQLLELIAGPDRERKFQASVNGGEFIRLSPQSDKDHRDITTYLKENNIQGYIFPLGVVKPLKVVIRGLPKDIPIEEIENELKKLNFPVIKVTQLIKRKDGTPMPLFQIQLTPSDHAKTIFDLPDLFFIRIQVEKYRSPFQTAQCHNCNFFHHHSANCLMQPRCVKCAGPHKTQECPHGKEKMDEPKCCNCNGKHPANYRGCPKFPHNKPQPNRINQKTNFTPTSYAQAVSPPPTTQTQINANTSQNLATIKPSSDSNPKDDIYTIQEICKTLNDCKSMLGIKDLNELLEKCREIKYNMTQAKTTTEKMMIFCDGLMNAAPELTHGLC